MTIGEIFLRVFGFQPQYHSSNAAYLFISQRHYIILTIVQDNIHSIFIEYAPIPSTI